MADIKDFLTGDGDVNQDMLDAMSVYMNGLGPRANGTETQKKRSAEAARFIAAKYAKRLMDINNQLTQQQQKAQSLQRSLPAHDPYKKK